MPVRFLSDAELARLSGWPDEIVAEDLVTYFTLSADDLAWLADGFNRDDNRLGAVQLCALLWLGWIPDDQAGCPAPALARLATASGISEDALAWTAQWYLRQETLRAANTRLVNAHRAHPLTALWGGGTLSSSDGQRFPQRGRSLTARALSQALSLTLVTNAALLWTTTYLADALDAVLPSHRRSRGTPDASPARAHQRARPVLLPAPRPARGLRPLREPGADELR